MEETGSERDLIIWLRLIRADLSPLRFAQLCREFGCPQRIVETDPQLLAMASLTSSVSNAIANPDWAGIKADLAWMERPGNYFITCRNPRYPAILREIPDPPIALFVRGNVDVLSSTQIAIVGSRKPTAGGRRLARDFAGTLAANGITVTSGLATGIDSFAHQGALSVNARTIAVLASGLDTIYPKTNSQLADQICERGALVSELPLFSKPLPHNFPRRNRIISGLSVGTLVVEAAMKSGSLITARMAMEQGREVFAVPGSIHNPLSRGCHALIRDGAKLTESITDILEEIGHLHSFAGERSMCPEKQSSNEGLDESSKLLLDNIGYDPVTIDGLVEETGISANVTAAVLLELELQNLIESLPGGSFIRKTRDLPK